MVIEIANSHIAFLSKDSFVNINEYENFLKVFIVNLINPFGDIIQKKTVPGEGTVL